MEFFPDIPGYSIESKIAEGRISEVYLGVQEDLDRKVAIKVLNPELFANPTVAREFQKATKLLTQMAHPNMVRMLEAGEHNGIYFVVMEYLPDSLRKRIQKPYEVSSSALDELQGSGETGPSIEGFALITLFKQLAQVLEFVHQDGIVMQDLRPENIRFREDGSPALMGFFLARVFASGISLPTKTAVKSLPFYVSPEKALRKPMDNTSDFYSLGVVFYELLTGGVPFIAEEAIAIENLHIMEPVPRLPREHAHFQPAIDGLMAKTPGERIASVNGLIKVLDDLSYDMPENRRTEKRELKIPPPPDPVPLFFDELPQPSSPPSASMPPPIPDTPAGLPDEFTFEGPPPVPPPVPPPSDLPELDMPESLDDIPVPDSEGEDDLIPSLDDFGVESKKGKNKERKFSMPRISMPDFNFDMETILEKIREPRVFAPILGVLVIIIALVVFLGPSGDSDESSGGAVQETTGGSGETSQTEAKLTPEQQREIDQKYQHKLNLAKRMLNKGQFQGALKRLKEAESFKKTNETKKMAQKIKDRMATQKDDNAYKKAQSENTAEAYEAYLEQFPSGRHMKEAETLVNKIKEEKRKQDAEIRRRLASSIRLPSEPKDLSTDDAKAMLVRYNFFDKYYNKNGDFKNYFVPRQLENQKVVVDYATALMWHQSGSPLYMKWDGVNAWVRELNKKGYAGYKDWRLPTLAEAISLMESTEALGALFIDRVFDREQRFVWTADKYEGGKVWAVDYFGGDINHVGTHFEAYVRPVRNLTAGSNNR